MLSLNIRTEQWKVGAICSNINHSMIIATISRSELVMVPLGGLSPTTRLLIPDSHYTCHTVFRYDAVVIVHTPPAPILEVSIFSTL